MLVTLTGLTLLTINVFIVPENIHYVPSERHHSFEKHLGPSPTHWKFQQGYYISFFTSWSWDPPPPWGISSPCNGGGTSMEIFWKWDSSTQHNFHNLAEKFFSMRFTVFTILLFLKKWLTVIFHLTSVFLIFGGKSGLSSPSTSQSSILIML